MACAATSTHAGAGGESTGGAEEAWDGADHAVPSGMAGAAEAGDEDAVAELVASAVSTAVSTGESGAPQAAHMPPTSGKASTLTTRENISYW